MVRIVFDRACREERKGKVGLGNNYSACGYVRVSEVLHM